MTDREERLIEEWTWFKQWATTENALALAFAVLEGDRRGWVLRQGVFEGDCRCIGDRFCECAATGRCQCVWFRVDDPQSHALRSWTDCYLDANGRRLTVAIELYRLLRPARLEAEQWAAYFERLGIDP